jgi:hypothetical protein
MCQNLDLRFLLFYCLFVKVFFSFFLFIRLFSLFFLSVWLSFLFFFSVRFFIAIRFLPSCSPFLCPCFSAHVVSSLAYPNLLGTKRLGCCCHCFMWTIHVILDPRALLYRTALCTPWSAAAGTLVPLSKKDYIRIEWRREIRSIQGN